MASSAASSTVTQNSPGATRRRMPRSGSSANANSRSTISPNGQDLLRRHPRAALDPQVLAGDERTSRHRFTLTTPRVGRLVGSVVADGAASAAGAPGRR